MKHSPVSVPDTAGAADSCDMQAQHLRHIIDEFCTNLDRVSLKDKEECFLNADTEKRVRRVIHARRARAQFFDEGLFADPAWDMLLELFASDLANRRISVTSLCGGAAVPATTALRWIRTLEVNGLIVRREDPLDGRRAFLSLSPSAYSAMAAFFATAYSVPLI